jgi:two-component system, NarL family, response regulator DegU
MLTVVLIDDHPIVRAGMRAILNCADDISVVGEGGSSREALHLVSELSPDVLVLDIGLPDSNGNEVVSRLKETKSKTSILILTAHNDPQIIFNLLENGATGYVLKDEALETLANAVRAAAAGKSWLSPSVANQVIQRAISQNSNYSGQIQNSLHDEVLTNREKEILCLLAEGLDNEAIAERLTLTKRTVQNHISTIYGKMGVNSRTEAMLYAIQHGLTKIAR